MNFDDIKHPKQKGEATESIIIGELMKRGVLCCKPVGDNLPFDLLIYKQSDGSLIKVQSRTATDSDKKNPNQSFGFKTISSRINTKKYYKIDNKSKVDYFLSYYSGTDKVYFTKSEPTLPEVIHLRLSTPKNNMKKNIKFACDYELDKIVALFL